MRRKIIGTIYPAACPLCGRVLEIRERLVCASCRVVVPYLKAPLCLKCGKEIEDEDNELCSDCGKTTRSFVKGFPVFNYIEPVSDSLAGFKYYNKRSYSKYYAYEIARRHGKSITDVGADVLMPVPIHKSKLRKRGYNQAELIAKDLGEYLGIPVDTDAIERCINTLPQKKLDDQQREQNLKRAFISTGKIVKYNKVILVDDIYTTGATIEACTKVLHHMGVRDVYYTSVCIGKGY